MTKRIFAIVLALIMSLSVLAVDVFAAGATATLSGNNITITCNEAGAAKYAVDLFKDGASYAGVKEITGSTLSATFNNLPAGAYFAYVRPYDANGISLVTNAYQTNAVNITSGTGTGNNTGVLYQAYFGPYLVTKFADKATVSWSAIAGAAQYRITYKVNGVEKQGITGSPVFEVPAKVGESFMFVADVFSTTASMGSLGTQTIPAGTTGGSSTGVGGGTTTGTGTLSITKSANSSAVTWKAVANASGYLVEYKTSTATTATSTFVTTPYATVPVKATESWTVTVKALVNGQFVTVGSASVTAGYGNTTGNSGIITSGSVTVTKGTNSANVKWNAVPSATGYIVYYKKTGETAANTVYATVNQATVPCKSSDSWVVEVRAIVNGSLTTVGSATVTPGSVTSGTTTGTVTTAGMNCTVISTYSSSTITWNGNSSSYMVIYTENGKGAKVQTVVGKSVTVPVGYNTSFSVIVIDTITNATVATAEVKASSGSTNSTGITKTEIKNLTLDYVSGWNTTVSWNKVEGAQFYQIDHALLGAQVGETEVNTKNTVTLPYGKNINFQVIVTAFMKDGTKKTVGYAYHVAGTTAGTTTPDTTPDVEVAEEFDTVTGFWAETMGDGIVKLNWNAVEDCDTYKVYYRKVGATKWSGGHSRTKTFLNIDFGSKTSTYEFKIVAGDEESTILTLKPSAAKGTVAWAMNPESDAKFETNLAGVVKDADNGKITLTWDEVDGVKYKVYYRKAGTTTWKGGYDRNGESITITFKASNIDNDYEVMIKAGNKESDVFTIDTTVWTNAD